MKNTLFIFLVSLLIACNSSTPMEDNVAEVDNNETAEVTKQMEEPLSLLLQIPEEYILVEIDPNENYEDSLTANYWSYNNANFEAMVNEEQNLIAVNNLIDNGDCYEYKNFLLQQDGNGDWLDVFNEFFPDLSLYSFYGFEDRVVGQFEGDEKIVFAGYQFHFDKVDSVGIQFMFCNLNSEENTQELNKNGRIIYKGF